MYTSYRANPSNKKSRHLFLDANIIPRMGTFLFKGDDTLIDFYNHIQMERFGRLGSVCDGKGGLCILSETSDIPILDPSISLVERCSSWDGKFNRDRAIAFLSNFQLFQESFLPLSYRDPAAREGIVDEMVDKIYDNKYYMPSSVHGFLANFLYSIKVNSMYRELKMKNISKQESLELFLDWACDTTRCPAITPIPFVWGVNFFDGTKGKKQRARSISKTSNIDEDRSNLSVLKCSWNAAWDFTYRLNVESKYADYVNRYGIGYAEQMNPSLLTLDKDASDINNFFRSPGGEDVKLGQEIKYLRAFLPVFDSENNSLVMKKIDERSELRDSFRVAENNSGKSEIDLFYEPFCALAREHSLHEIYHLIRVIS